MYKVEYDNESFFVKELSISYDYACICKNKDCSVYYEFLHSVDLMERCDTGTIICKYCYNEVEDI